MGGDGRRVEQRAEPRPVVREKRQTVGLAAVQDAEVDCKVLFDQRVEAIADVPRLRIEIAYDCEPGRRGADRVHRKVGAVLAQKQYETPPWTPRYISG